MGKETSKKLLADLRDNSSSLDKLVQDFAKMVIAQKIQIRCFYETRETHILKALSGQLAKMFPRLKKEVQSTFIVCDSLLT